MKSSPARSKPGSRARGAGRRAAAATSEALLERIDGGDFPATLYLDGPSEPVKAALLAEFRRAWAAACPESPRARVFRAAEAGVEEILSAYQGASLFSPRDLVMVLGVEDLVKSEKRIAALAGGIARPAGGSSLVLVERAAETERKKLEPLRAACAARITALAPARPALLAWGRRRLAREGLAAGPGAIEALVDACEGDPLAFFSELDKLCTYTAGAGRATAGDVAALLRPVVGADLPDYLSAVALGEPGLAAQRLGRLLAAGVGEGAILFALSNLVGGALGGWAKFREPSQALQRRLRPDALGRAADAVYRAEAAWKSGRADVVAALEQATRDVASAA